MFEYDEMFFFSLLLGFLARALMLKIDYRQFPSYPHSYVIHLTLGAIAAALGALVIPLLLEKEFIAITFITIAAQQFRDVRSMERESLAKIEKTELIPRGEAYIEGIAKLFEARNYLALISSFTTNLIYYYSNWYIALLGGSLVAYGLHSFMKGPTVGEIADVEVVEISIKKKSIGIDEVIMMNVGEEEALEIWSREGIGVKIIPRDEDARATLANLGQRQAILHDLSILMGIKLDLGLQHFSPLARLNIDNGSLNIIFIPQEPDEIFIKEAVERIPVLESSQRKPLKDKIGRKAAD